MTDLTGEDRIKASLDIPNLEDIQMVLFDEATDGMFITDPQGERFMAVNTMVTKLTGYSHREILGMLITNLIPPEDLAIDPVSMDILRQGKTVVKERRIRRKDDKLVPVEISARMLPAGNLLGIVRDITDRRQAEEDLLIFKASLENATDAIGFSTPQGRHYYQNKAFCNMFGNIEDFSPANQYVDKNDWQEIFRTISSGGQWIGEVQMYSKEKNIIDIYLRAYANRNSEGLVTALVGVHTDISERKRAEERYRSTIENSPEGMLFYRLEEDNKLILIGGNPAADKLLGIKLAQFIGKTIEAVFPALIHTAIPERYRHVAATGQKWETDSIAYDHNGIKGVYSVIAFQTEPNQMVAMFSDISERKHAEESITKEMIFSENIINSLPGVFYMYDDDGKLVRWNKRHEEVTGYSSEELFGMDVLEFFSEAQKEYIWSRIQIVFSEGESFAEAPLLVRDGREVPYFFTGRLVTLDNKQYMIGLGLDIAAHKRAQEEKEALHEQLLQAQKMESIGRLAGGVAHDFNNMLSGILGQAELAMMRCAPSERVHSSLRVIKESALRSADLIRQLLAFARKQTVAPNAMDLNDSVTGMFKMLRRLIGENIDLVWMPGAGLWAVKMDPSQVDQILVNLCINARDAINGVGRITIETGNIFLDDNWCAVNSGYSCGEYVMLAVSDNGCGMSKDIVEHVFEPFFTTKKVGQGTGLGLATVYGIVKQNEGFVDVRSRPGRGTVLKIYLPRFIGEIDEPEIEKTGEAPKGSGEAVLLVEDESMILNVGREMLEELGYRVMTAGTPGEAIRQAKAHSSEIQLLITDVVMPEMNGRDLAKLVRGIIPGLKCLFISGYTADVISHGGVLDKSVQFLQKPFTINELALKVLQELMRK